MREGDIVRIRRGEDYCSRRGDNSIVQDFADYEWLVEYRFADYSVLKRVGPYGIAAPTILIANSCIIHSHTITLEDGTKVEISDESYQALRKAVK